MKWVVRILAVLVLLIVVAGAAAFFLLPKTVTANTSVLVARPAYTVVTWLSTTPAGSGFGDGATVTVTNATAQRIQADLDFGKSKAELVYALSEAPEGVTVALTATRDLGGDIFARMNATGAQAALQAKLDAGKQVLEGELNALPTFDFKGLQYEIVDVASKPFIYIQAPTKQAAANIKNAYKQSLSLVRTAIATNNLQEDGRPMAVELGWENGQYSFQAGVPFKGEPPELFGVIVGKSPEGRTIKVIYKGSEDNVIPVYDQIESLITASHLKRSGPSFEIYNDDPTQAGGPMDREIYHIVEGDTDALKKIPTN